MNFHQTFTHADKMGFPFRTMCNGQNIPNQWSYLGWAPKLFVVNRGYSTAAADQRIFTKFGVY